MPGKAPNLVGANEVSVPTVLIADNDSDVSDLLRDVLQRRGLHVERCFDGEAAGAMVRELGVQVLVCDLDMPRASGVEVVDGLSDMANPPAVVVISGFMDAATEQRLRAQPFVREVLRKPFDVLLFAHRVEALLKAAAPAEAGEG